MAAFKLLEDVLEYSGWSAALVQADIAAPSVADAFLKTSHLTRKRRAHQITASSLHILPQKAYQ